MSDERRVEDGKRRGGAEHRMDPASAGPGMQPNNTEDSIKSIVAKLPRVIHMYARRQLPLKPKDAP